MLSLNSIFDALRGHDSYELRDRVIYRKRDFREDSLSIDEIESWSIYPEMGVDLVELRRKDGATAIWFDYKNDLISILRGFSEESV